MTSPPAGEVREFPRTYPAIDAQTYRGAMRRLAGGISIITVGQGEDVSGLTVTSVSSISANPPAVLFCINRESSSWPLLTRYRSFGVNGLSADHQTIAAHFSGKDGIKGADRFREGCWIELVTGVRLLADALFALDCVVDEIVTRTQSSIVIGSVVGVRLRDEQMAASPLIYWQGAFGTLQR